MTVSTTTNVSVQRGNDAADTFVFNFLVLKASHLTVERRVFATGIVDKVYTPSEYTLTGVGTTSGSVQLAAGALASTYEIVITRTVPYKQELDIVNQGGFLPEVVEEQLDLTAMGLQQVANKADRALIAPVGDTLDPLPVAAVRANQFIVFDALGQPSISEGSGTDTGLRSDLGSTTSGKGSALSGHIRAGSGASASNVRAALNALPSPSSGYDSLQEALDAERRVFLSASVTGTVPIVFPDNIELDGRGFTLETTANGGAAEDDCTVYFGVMHHKYANDLTQHTVISVSDNVVELDAGEGASYAAGDVMLLRGPNYKTVNTFRQNEVLWGSRVRSVDGDNVTLERSAPVDVVNAASLQAANANEGITLVNDNDLTTRLVAQGQHVHDLEIVSANGKTHHRGGTIGGRYERLKLFGTTAYTMNFGVDTTLRECFGQSTHHIFEFANNSRNLRLVDCSGELIGNTFSDDFCGVFSESSRDCVVSGGDWNCGPYVSGSGNGCLMWSGGKGNGIENLTWTALNDTGNIFEIRSVDTTSSASSDYQPAATDHFIRNVTVYAGTPARFLRMAQGGNSPIKRFTVENLTCFGTVGTDGALIAGSDHRFINGWFETGGMNLANATGTTVTGFHLPNGFTNLTPAIEAANKLYNNTSTRSLANNAVSAASDTFQVVVAAGTASGSPAVISSAIYAAGNLAKWDTIRGVCFGQASTTATENRTVKAQMSIDGGSAWIDIGSIVTTTSGQDWRLEVEVEIESNAVVSTSVMQVGPSSTTENAIRTTGANLASNGLRFRFIAYMDASTGTNTVHRSYWRDKTPGMKTIPE